MTDPLTIPKTWDDVTPAWMTAAIQSRHPGAVVDDVTLVTRDDGTNRRARFGLTYATGSGPATVFAKAESDVPGRRKIHARNGNLFNEPLLFSSGVELPLEHPVAFAAVIDEPGLDYVIVMEDLVARGADPRNATRPFTVEQVARGVRSLAPLHSRYWNAVADELALHWVRPFEPGEGWLAPMRVALPQALEKAGDALPDAIREVGAEALVDLWVQHVRSLTSGPQTLLHGDPHIGNTYLLPDGEVGFLDWQVVRTGHWSHDVGYFIQSSLSSSVRRDAEAELIAEYCQVLDVASDERPTAEDAWVRYRASAAHGLVIWLVTLLSDVHSEDALLAVVNAYGRAFVELDTVGAVRSVSLEKSAHAG